MQRGRIRRTWMVMPLVFLVAGPIGSLRGLAEEPCEDFVAALREERMFDVAIDYLDAMKTSTLAPPEFKERIPLFKVDVLLDEASQIRDQRRLTERLNQSQKILAEFLDSNASATLLAEAQQQRAKIFMARARMLLEESESDRLTIEQKNEKQEQAREYLRQATAAYEDIRQRLRTELEKPLDPQNPNAHDERKKLRNNYVLVRLQSPRIKEQIAESYGEDHPQYETLLNEAANENLELYDKYKGGWKVSGINGCLGAARCFEKLGNPTKALGYLQDVFDLPRGPRQLAKKREAALIAIKCWEALDPYPLEEAFARLRIVVYSLSPEYAKTPSGIRLRMEFAKVCKAIADKIEEAGGPSDPESRNRYNLLLKEAARWMRALARTPGPHREQARQYLADWGNSIVPEIDEDQGPPETMSDARQRGKDLQLQVTELKSSLENLQEEWEAADDRQKPRLKPEIENLKKQIESRSKQALKMFDLALSMTTEETAADDLSNLRYLQCATYYQMERFFEAAVIGEYLIQNFPTNSGTQPAAGLVCKSYWNLYRQEGKSAGDSEAIDRSFERDNLVKHCNYIFNVWPGSKQADQAGVIMTLLMLSEGQPLKSVEYLKQVAPDSPTRAALVLEVGNRLWQAYLRQRPKSGEPGESLVAMRTQAGELLRDGVARLDRDKLSPYEARSALALIELDLESGNNDLAIEQLETAKIAPLDLVKSKHPAAVDSNFRVNTYKTALRAYLAKFRSGDDTMTWVEKSQAVLRALQNEIGGTQEGQKQLSEIYLTLARELKQQFERLENNEQRSAFATGLESFLTALGTSANDQNLLMLTGSMLTEIGLGLKESGLTTEARRFFEQAIKVYQKLNTDEVNDPLARLTVHRGLANALRGSGQYERAIKLFGDILADPKNRMYSDLQVDAALTYTEWGLAKNDPDALVKAIRGGEVREVSDGKEVNAIIGWLNLGQAAQRMKNADLFAQAVYNLARCKFWYGKYKNNPKVQQDAIQEVEDYLAKSGTQASSDWIDKLEKLLSQLKQEKGE